MTTRIEKLQAQITKLNETLEALRGTFNEKAEALAAAQAELSSLSTFRHRFIHPAIHHMDHPANRAAPIAQCCRAAQHLQSAHQLRVDRDGMVRRNA